MEQTNEFNENIRKSNLMIENLEFKLEEANNIRKEENNKHENDKVLKKSEFDKHLSAFNESKVNI